MTSAELGRLHERIDDQQSTLASVMDSCARIDERTRLLHEVLERRLDELQASGMDTAGRLAIVERKAAWVQAWSAGAAAIFGALVWLLSQVPMGVWSTIWR